MGKRWLEWLVIANVAACSYDNASPSGDAASANTSDSGSDATTGSPSGTGDAGTTDGARDASSGSSEGGGAPTPAILKGASWSLDRSRALTTVAWVDRHGKSVQTTAVAGEVALLVDPATSPATATAFATQHGGTVFAELPVPGLYWVRVAGGQEASFIAAAMNAWTAVPNLVTVDRELTVPPQWADTATSSAPIVVTTGNLVLDDFTSPMCLASCNLGMISTYLQVDPAGRLVVDMNGKLVETVDRMQAASHGQVVDFFRTDGYALYPADPSLATSRVSVSDHGDLGEDLIALAAMLGGAQAASTPSVINYSRGPNEGTLAVALDRQTANQSFLDALMALLSTNASGASSALVIQAAGNTATDLTSVLVEEQTFSRAVASQIIEVGALDTRGQIESYSNYSTSAGTMLYVPVTSTTNNGKLVSGTSFAAPQVEYLVAQIRHALPRLTPAQIRQVLFDPSVAPLQSVQQPNAPFGQTISVPVIANPLDPAVLKAALEVASVQFPAGDGGTPGPTADAGADAVTEDAPAADAVAQDAPAAEGSADAVTQDAPAADTGADAVTQDAPTADDAATDAASMSDSSDGGPSADASAVPADSGTE
jgi:hypothetical protein